jgi:glycosyltransferase involved in cell wall biosynthesis
VNKILHIITSLDRGGAENHLASLAALQAKQKNDVHIIYFRGNDYWVEFLNKKKISIKKFDIKKNFHLINFFLVIFKIFYFIRKTKPDIVHAHLGLSEIIGLTLKTVFKLNFKFIITKHLDSFLFEGSRGQNHLFNGIFFEKKLFKAAEQVIFISKNVKFYFLSKINISSKKTSVIYYGVNRKNILYKKNKIKKIVLKKKHNEKFILNISRHVPQKRVDLIIKGFAEYQKKNRNTKLILVGYGSETLNLKLLAKKININASIYWINYTDNVSDLFKISDLFCLSSTYEGLGLVLLESLLLKVPVITINASAMKEVIKNNYSGILMPKNPSPKNFSKAISKILDNSEFREMLIKNGTITIKEDFNEKKMLKLTTNIYKRI